MIDLHIHVQDEHGAFIDRERRRLELADPDGRKYSKNDVIVALIEFHMARRELADMVLDDYRELLEEHDELLARSAQS